MLVDSTKCTMAIDRKSLPNAAIDDKIRQMPEDADFSAKIKIGIGLLILPVVPGAGVVAGGAGEGAVDVYGAFQDFYWEKAASGERWTRLRRFCSPIHPCSLSERRSRSPPGRGRRGQWRSRVSSRVQGRQGEHARQCSASMRPPAAFETGEEQPTLAMISVGLRPVSADVTSSR